MYENHKNIIKAKSPIKNYFLIDYFDMLIGSVLLLAAIIDFRLMIEEFHILNVIGIIFFILIIRLYSFYRFRKNRVAVIDEHRIVFHDTYKVFIFPKQIQYSSIKNVEAKENGVIIKYEKTNSSSNKATEKKAFIANISIQDINYLKEFLTKKIEESKNL